MVDAVEIPCALCGESMLIDLQEWDGVENTAQACFSMNSKGISIVHLTCIKRAEPYDIAGMEPHAMWTNFDSFVFHHGCDDATSN